MFKDENGNTLPIEDNRVWTGTSWEGKHHGPDCNGWTTTTGEGVSGEAEFTDGRWSDHGTESCALPKRLYCLGQ